MRKIKQEFTAERDESITVDEEARAIAMVAASNGCVVGHGRDVNGTTVTESTQDKPWVHQIRYNPAGTTPYEAMVTATENLPGHG